MSSGILEHYQEHKILGTPSIKDGLPIQLPTLSQEEINLLDDLEGPDEEPYLQAGMLLYNTDTETVQVYDGVDWISL